MSAHGHPGQTLQYLGQGTFRTAYSILEDGRDSGRVLKVDGFRTRETADSPALYTPYSVQSAGCLREALTYEVVKERCPHLLPFFAEVYSSGPGWLVQELLPYVGEHSGAGAGSVAHAEIRSLRVELSVYNIGVKDLACMNVGRRIQGGHIVALDYACSDIQPPSQRKQGSRV